MAKRLWTTAQEIEAQVEKIWERGDILRAALAKASLFPLEIRLKRPSPAEIAARFGDVQDWVRGLVDAEKKKRGFGFELRWESVRNRVQGTNDMPVAAVIPTESDALRFIRRETQAALFNRLAQATMARYPVLAGYLMRRPLHILRHAAAWDRALAVVDRFASRPRPGIYLRQLDIPGVDTKFIEAHRALLSELLDEVLPETDVDTTATGAKAFNRRYGLRDEPPLVRFRLLDPALYVQGLSDLSLPPDQFATLNMPLRTVFITENRTNGLAFPDSPGAAVIFGLGYGLERLTEVAWLRRIEVHYWGDIDTHGFGILNRLRAVLPHARSFLMDRPTLEAHRALWGREPEDRRYIGEPTHLSSSEYALFDDLRKDRLGECVRLEQEQISFGWLMRTLLQP